ncbi:DUF6968 family protein [Planctellipticum variicoloris]|uniref:DUF6968 family protein n=1 Tax=Planctellipticum variicoloris TaxID=3064265 RepID=UPI003AF4C18E
MSTQPLTRRLTLRQAGVERPVTVSIGWPDIDPDRRCWGCTLTAPFLFKSPIIIYGDDGVQALLLSLNFICREIKTLQEHGITVYWTSPGDEGDLVRSVMQ